MNTKPLWRQPRKIAAVVVLETMLLHAAAPAFATVSQNPGIYLTPPLPNVMFTLDDSGSMTSDAIPDLDTCYKDSNDGTFLPNSSSLTDSSNCGTVLQAGNGSQLPSMWKTNSRYLQAKYYQSTNAVARYLRSSAGNPLYYDPTVTYLPWIDPSDDTKRYSNADPAKVVINSTDWRNGGRTIDLTTRLPNATGADDETANYWPGTYYVYNDQAANPLPLATPDTSLNVASKFTKYEVKPKVKTYPRAASRTDCSGAVGTDGCLYAEELQNFANWLQFYRSRMLMAKGGVSAAFAKQATNLRVGFTTINTGSIVKTGVAKFEGSARSDFYSNLFEQGNNGSTPLRQAMDYVGKYFQGGTKAGNPWAEDTSKSPTQADSCRRSFHIMSTDGFWNGSDASSPANKNNDTFAGSKTPARPDGTQYDYSDTAGTPGSLAARFTVNPYADNNTSNKSTLADVAAYYWRTDLQSSLDNLISPSSRDPAYWQHLTTFTVGLGVSGTGGVRPNASALKSDVVAATGQYVVPASTPSTSSYYPYRGQPWLSSQALRDQLITDKIPMIWTTPAGDQPETGDDLVHASMNGHGRYFSATNPTDLSTGLAAALSEATNQPQSTANLVTLSGELSSTNRVFQAVYNPYGWTGRVYAFPIVNGAVNTDPSTASWEVSKAMPTPDNRNIYTWDASTTTQKAVPFTWASLNGTQKTNLNNDSTLLDWLRGSSANEAQNGGSFRDRIRDTTTAGVLGDIVGSSPVKGPDAGGGYQRMAAGVAGQATYANYRSTANTALDAMRASLFFGANDGMFHVVNTNDGVERFAFVPNSVYNVARTYYEGSLQSSVQKLRKMADPAYSHLFTVNGPPQVGDAYDTSGTAWKTILLGSTGVGARSVFAMDVTNPVVGSTGFGTSKILWEFSAEDTANTARANMGSVTSYPHIARMRDGTWVAMFGNGYDSSTGQATLYLLNLFTGAVVWQKDVGTAGGNGLSQPNFILNSNREVTAIYAGDLKGNLWKFDVDDPIKANWKVSFSGTPLYTGSTSQPITVMPEITFHTAAGGVVVSFGTGKFFENEDMGTSTSTNVNLSSQAIVGIWDKPGETAGINGKGSLVQQANTSATTTGFTGTTTTNVDWATKRGWYITLTNATGERVNVNPQQQGRILFVVANTPSNVTCSSGGTARIFALDPITGQAPSFSVFDANRDGSINSDDKAYNVLMVSSGVLSLPRILGQKGDTGVITPEAVTSRGQTAANLGGVESNKSGCAGTGTGTMIVGDSDTGTESEKVRTCEGKGRVSWRQLK